MTAHQDVAGLVGETRTVHDPFLQKDVQVSSNLIDRLRGKYACGPIMENGEPEFGWREFQTAPIQHEAADRLEYLSQALREAEAERWQSIDTAPKDGTHILVWFIHANARYSKDPVAEGWACAHEAHWIDHNGGGWTWYGLCGVATYWQPLPKPPSTNKEDGK